MIGDYDYEAAVIAMLTLRLNTPSGEWLSDEDHETFWSYEREAIAAEGAEEAGEALLLTMMNMAWYALINLASVTGESESSWLQRIAVDLRDAPDPPAAQD